jgi:hypothetical protein
VDERLQIATPKAVNPWQRGGEFAKPYTVNGAVNLYGIVPGQPTTVYTREPPADEIEDAFLSGVIPE